jgi:predicted GIY-YIG superfamily endonuclease
MCDIGVPDGVFTLNLNDFEFVFECIINKCINSILEPNKSSTSAAFNAFAVKNIGTSRIRSVFEKYKIATSFLSCHGTIRHGTIRVLDEVFFFVLICRDTNFFFDMYRLCACPFGVTKRVHYFMEVSSTSAKTEPASALQDYRSTAAAKHAAWLLSQTKTTATPTPSAAPSSAPSSATPSSATPPPAPSPPIAAPQTSVLLAGEGTRYIYVLLCSGGKYYVGETYNVEERFAQHLASSMSKSTSSVLKEKENTTIPGAAWTRKHEPIEVVKRFVKQSVHDEDNTTLDYMVEHGIRNVRGGSFCMVKLPRHIRRTIKQRLATIKKLCYRCKQPGHCANTCPTQPPSQPQPGQSTTTTIKPILPSQRRSWIDYDSEEDEEETKASTTAIMTQNNPLFSFDAKSSNSNSNNNSNSNSNSNINSNSTSTTGSGAGASGEEAERWRAPRPQGEPERLMDFEFDVDVVSRPRRPPPLRYLPKTVPLPPQICARCGRNNHSEYQCFAKHHLHGHLLPPR